MKPRLAVGRDVTIRGDVYRVLEIGKPGTGKFFGRCVVRAERDGITYLVMSRSGKIAWNSRLDAVKV